jgi:hypothetical protein
MACAAIGAAVGGAVWAVEIYTLQQGIRLPHLILQHGICNELHTLAGGILGSTPVATGLTVLSTALAKTGASQVPELGANSLALVTVAVAAPAVLLVHKALRALAGDTSGWRKKLLVYGMPLLAVTAVLGVPTGMLNTTMTPELTTRFVIGFGAGMAGAVVREALTQASAVAWIGVERSGSGMDYGLSEAQGQDRIRSTVLSTLGSCMLFAGSTALVMHALENWIDLGMAPAGRSLLSLSAAEVASRVALRSLLMQSVNELLEGIWRCLPLAAYAHGRGIKLRYHNADAGLINTPSKLAQRASGPITLRKAAVFAAARMLDGMPPNLLVQLSVSPGQHAYWNGFRIAAVLMTGATMARTPVIAAHLLPLIEPPAFVEAAPDSRTSASCKQLEPATSNDNDNDAATSVIVSISSDSSGPETSSQQSQSISACTPVSDRRLAWA